VEGSRFLVKSKLKETHARGSRLLRLPATVQNGHHPTLSLWLFFLCEAGRGFPLAHGSLESITPKKPWAMGNTLSMIDSIYARTPTIFIILSLTSDILSVIYELVT
jgi:hypothetical protein